MAIVITTVVVYLAWVPLLTFVGDGLVHSDPLERVDTMIVLASGMDRIIEAAELYQQGYTPQIVLTREAPDQSVQFLLSRGIEVETGEERRRRILNVLGVPLSAIIVLEDIIASTADEARIFARWASGQRIRSVMVVTSPPHSARARLTFLHALRDRQVKVLVHPSKLAPFRGDTWWQSRATLREGIYEWQKLVYYRLVELNRPSQ